MWRFRRFCFRIRFSIHYCYRLLMIQIITLWVAAGIAALIDEDLYSFIYWHCIMGFSFVAADFKSYVKAWRTSGIIANDCVELSVTELLTHKDETARKYALLLLGHRVHNYGITFGDSSNNPS